MQKQYIRKAMPTSYVCFCYCPSKQVQDQRKYVESMLAAEIIYFYQTAIVFMPVHILNTIFAVSPETA